MGRIIQTDSRDIKMPGPIIALSKSYKKARQGDIIELLANDQDVDSRVQDWCERTGNTLLKVEHELHGVCVVDIQITGKLKRRGMKRGQIPPHAGHRHS